LKFKNNTCFQNSPPFHIFFIFYFPPKMEAALRKATQANRRFHTTTRWLRKLYSMINDRSAKFDDISKLREQFYSEVCQDVKRPLEERVFDLTVQRDREEHNTLVSLDLSLEIKYWELFPVDASQSSRTNATQLRPERVSHHWANEASMEFVNPAGDTLLMKLVDNFHYVTESLGVILDKWMERTIDMARCNNQGRSVIWYAMTGRLGFISTSPKGILRILLQLGGTCAARSQALTHFPLSSRERLANSRAPPLTSQAHFARYVIGCSSSPKKPEKPSKIMCDVYNLPMSLCMYVCVVLCVSCLFFFFQIGPDALIWMRQMPR
jgi:hypothetical protein